MDKPARLRALARIPRGGQPLSLIVAFIFGIAVYRALLSIGGYSISRPGSGAHSSQTPTQIPQQTASLNRKSGPQGTADSGRTQRQGAHDSLDALHRSRRDKAAHAGPVGSSAGHANVHIDPNVISGALKGGHLTKQGLQGSQQKQQEKQIQNAAHQAAQQLQQQQQKQKEEEKAFVLPKPVRVVFPPAANQTGKAVECLRKKFVEEGPQDMRVFSQWGEDGILESIFACIGTTNKYYAEFGAESGTEVSTRWLREGHGWQGLLMDGGFFNPAINLQQEMIFAETISDQLHKYKVPFPAPDHITVDLDQNTWHVAAAIMKAGWRPRSLICEFNRNLLPHHSYAILYEKDRMWDGTCWFGASALAFVRLLEPYGYQLVAVDQFGINLFFVHNSALGPKPPNIHEHTPAQKHPLQQLWPSLHASCQSYTWFEIPHNFNPNTWNTSNGRRVALYHQDMPNGVRVLYEGPMAADDNKANRELASYSNANVHLRPVMENFGGRLREPAYSGLRVAKLPDKAPWDHSMIMLVGHQGPNKV